MATAPGTTDVNNYDALGPSQASRQDPEDSIDFSDNVELTVSMVLVVLKVFVLDLLRRAIAWAKPVRRLTSFVSDIELRFCKRPVALSK